MADATVANLGQINGANDTDALYLKIFAGEVLTQFARKNTTLDKVQVKTISNGKSAQFPVLGTRQVSAAYHTPGAEIVGQATLQNEKVVAIDGLLLSSVFIADIDAAMSHFDARAPYAKALGAKLSNEMDVNIFKEILKASRAASTITGGDGGTVLENADFASATLATKQAALAKGLFDAATALDEHEVDSESRYAAFSPADYYALASDTDNINKQWGGQGAYSDGTVLKIAGITILKSNQIPKTDTSGTDTKHGGANQFTVGCVWVPEAVGVVKLMDLQVQAAYDIRRQGSLTVARYAVGMGCLMPEAAISLVSDLPA